MKNTVLHELHAAAGAQLLPAGEPCPLLTYGDVPGEYRAAQEHCALFDETDRGLVRVSGEEGVEFLHRLLANDVRALTPGQGNRTLLLTPKGKVRFDVDLACTEDAVLLSTPPAGASSLVEALDTFLFAEAVEIVDATEEYAPLCLLGPAAAELVAALTGDAPPEEAHAHTRVPWEGHFLTVTSLIACGSRAWRLDAGPQGAPILWTALREAGAQPAGRVVADSLRVEACAALLGEDIDEGIYPQEARLESAFSLDKGCYIGQEVVAKIDTYGGLNKCLTILQVEHEDPVPRGTHLRRLHEASGEWRNVGMVTSWAWSFAMDAGLVLAHVKRRNQAPGTRFHLGDSTAEATVLAAPVRPGAVAPSGEFE